MKLRRLLIILSLFIFTSCSNDKTNIYTEYEYFESGALSAKYLMKDGKKFGNFIFYYETGNVHKEGFFDNDTINGVFIQYTETGDTLLKSYYIMGNMVKDYGYKENKVIYFKNLLTDEFILYKD